MEEIEKAVKTKYDDHISKVLNLFDTRKQLFFDKNSNYGCSYIKAGILMDTILEGNSLELKNSKDHMAYQLIIRKLDKLIRYCNLRFTGEKDKVGEKLNDTMSDDGVYAFMLAELDSSGDEFKK